MHVFRRDLRLSDNTALIASAKDTTCLGIVPVFVLPDEQIDPAKNKFFSHAAVQFMCACLRDLDTRIRDLTLGKHGLFLVRAPDATSGVLFALEHLKLNLRVQQQSPTAGAKPSPTAGAKPSPTAGAKATTVSRISVVNVNLDDSAYAREREERLLSKLSKLKLNVNLNLHHGDYGLLPGDVMDVEQPERILKNLFNKIMVDKPKDAARNVRDISYEPRRKAPSADDALVLRKLAAVVATPMKHDTSKNRKKEKEFASCRFLSVDELDSLYEGVPSPIETGSRAAGLAALERMKELCHVYGHNRDFPSLEEKSTTRASPHLKFGTISIREAFEAAGGHSFDSNDGQSNDNDGQNIDNDSQSNDGQSNDSSASCNDGNKDLARELVFREFYRRLFAPRPELHMLRAAFLGRLDGLIPWRSPSSEKELWRAWTTGQTGVPLVDAGMRQLLATGWTHNRVRMVVASFATRHLRFDWRDCARFYYTCLVDADATSNAAGWQWAAGVGVDSAPFFRFPLSPFRQSQRFDADARYIKTYVPELATVDAKIIHNWFDPRYRSRLLESQVHSQDHSQDQSDVQYPPPIIDVAAAAKESVGIWKAAAAEARK
jgi:deoxyribodipyrimidine photolyase